MPSLFYFQILTTGVIIQTIPLQKAAFSPSVKSFLNESSSIAFRIAFCEIPFSSEDTEDDGIFDDDDLVVGTLTSLQSLPGLAEIRIGNDCSTIPSSIVVRSVTLKRK